MPLMKSKSKGAFEHNLKAEMKAGKPQPQALAIAYSVKRKAKKASGGKVESGSPDMNMAEGGEVISAKYEKRPMPDNRYNDSAEAARNSGNKPPKNDSWTDTPTEQQAVNNNGRVVKPIKRPSMVPSDSFSTKLYDEEGNLQSSASPGPYGEQPPKSDDEEGPDRQGPKVSDMEDEHSTHRKPYAKGGEVESSDYDRPLHEAIDHPDRLSDEEKHLMSSESPSEDEGSAMAIHRNEEGPNRQGPMVPDMEDEHSTDRKPYAGGGRIGDTEANIDHEMELNPVHDHWSEGGGMSQPEDEAELMHAASLAAAIMAKRRMARGGEIKSADSIDSDSHTDMADLSRNADEDANMEDQASFRSLERENYSETPGLEALDSPMDSAQHGDDEEMNAENDHNDDLVSAIRRKMSKRSPITR